jgi:hypothetical protein
MTTTSNLDGLFYEKYSEKIENLIPQFAILRDAIPFIAKDKQNGNFYHQPVIVSAEQGFTYSAPNNGAYALNQAVSLEMQDAQVLGYQMTGRATLDYESASRSVGAGAFEDATVLQMTNILESANKRLELSLLYGQEGIGDAGAITPTDATHADVVFTVGSWADATWGGLENAVINFFVTGTGVLVGATAADQAFVVTKVNTTTRTVNVAGTAAGITALDAANTVSAFFAGSRTGPTAYSEMPGLSKIITNTGLLFNIDASLWDLWRGNTYTITPSAALTFAHVQQAVTVAVGRGLLGDVMVYVNPKAWSSLNTEQSALRMYDSSYSTSKLQNGVRALEFIGQNGKMTLVPHPFVKQGDAFVCPTQYAKRIGATDISFNLKGKAGKMSNEAMFQNLQDSNGFQYRLYSNQSLFLEAPAKFVKITGILVV